MISSQARIPSVVFLRHVVYEQVGRILVPLVALIGHRRIAVDLVHVRLSLFVVVAAVHRVMPQPFDMRVQVGQDVAAKYSRITDEGGAVLRIFWCNDRLMRQTFDHFQGVIVRYLAQLVEDFARVDAFVGRNHVF